MKTVLLLICSNIFMTIAWYGHLKYRKAPLITVIVISWLIAFAEYCFQVPANRIGYGEFSAFQLKVIQEVVTLTVFSRLRVAIFWRGLQMEPCRLVFVSGWRGDLRLLGKRVRPLDCQLKKESQDGQRENLNAEVQTIGFDLA